MYNLLTQLPLTVEERNNLVEAFYQGGTELELFALNAYCFWHLLNWFHSWFLYFSSIEHSLKTIKASRPFAFISLSGIVTRRIYKRQYK